MIEAVKRSGIGCGRFPVVLFLTLLGFSALPALSASPLDPLGNSQCDYWQTSDGLPNHDVVSLAQTPDGYIWVGMYGANNTVARFDGFGFDPAVNPPGRKDKAYTFLAKGKEGRLWISKASGAGSLTLWQGEKATPVEIKLPPPTQWGNPLLEDRRGNLWIGGGGLLLRAPGGQVQDFSAVSKGFGDVRQMAEDKNGAVWLATQNGLVRYQNGTFDQPYPITNMLYSIYPGRDGSLWVGTDVEPGLLQVSPTGAVVRYGQAQGLKSRGVCAIGEDQEANIWLGTYSGLYYLRSHRVYPIEETDLRTAFVFSLLWDREGSLWVGTSDGLYHLCRNPIEHYGAAAGLGPVNSLAIGPSGLFANIFSRGTYLQQGGAWTRQAALGESAGDGQLFETADGDIWLSTGSDCERYRGGSIREEEDMDGKAQFCQDRNTLWIVNATNVFAFRDDKLRPMAPGWPAMTITCLATNHDRGLVIGTTQGLYKWDGRLTRWLNFGSDLPGSRISGLQWDGAKLWIATDQAIACFGNQLQVIPAEAGLARTSGINSMLIERNSLWLGCVNGLFCINRNDVEQYAQGMLHHVTLTQYGKTHGMRSGYLGPTGWGLGAVRGTDGKLWFASRSGVVAVNTKDLLDSKPPPVVIESVLLDQQPVNNFRGNPDAPIKVPAGTRNVEIHYAALTYISPTMVVYKYRLRGLDTDWITADNSRVARFMQLPPGNYEFEVQARSSGGVWSEQGASVRFEQESFFRQTRAFYILCWSLGGIGILALAGCAAAVAHAVSSRKMRQQVAALEAQQALDRERARIARDIHDDVGSTLTRIVLLSELAKREPGQTYTPDGHLASIRSAAREITRRLDEIVWAINPRNDTLDALVSYLSKLITDQARAAGLNCRLDVPPTLPACPMSGTTRHNIFLACKEAINNAIKHAAAKQLQLRMTLQNESFLLEICDDGIGLAAALPEPGGNGLLNLRERLAASGGTCDLTSRPGGGTVVGFRLPCIQSSVSTK
jgi:signal transduction histidine kinase/ligand-binding sensor domain-containing protein